MRRFKLIWWFWIAEKEISKRWKKTQENNEAWVVINPVIKEIIDKYYNIWIREFFIWYNPSYWHNEFWFEFSPNGRFWENEQITSYETFKQAIEYVHSLKLDNWLPCEIFLTVNAWFYSDVTMPLLKKIIDEAISAWIDWFIISNFEVLEYLSKIGFKWKINISTIFSVFNEDAISFLIDYFNNAWLNLARMILPREVTLFEIKRLCEMYPKLKFEIFWHWDYCRYSNWLCFAEHKYFSRDLCTFVLKHWLEVKKSIRYDFKKLILDDTLSNIQKQNEIDNSLNDLDDVFISHNLVSSNTANTIFDQCIMQLQDINFDIEQKHQLANKLYSKLKLDLKLNYFKYIYDWLRPDTDLHNAYILKILWLIEIIKQYVEFDEWFLLNLQKINNYKTGAQEYYKNLLSTKWKFSVETYYKFMLYNRVSIPFYKYFNEIQNIEVVKIPLRWRDLTVMTLWLNLIDDAIQDPEKYIDYGNLSWKYFHYDPSWLDIFQTKI